MYQKDRNTTSWDLEGEGWQPSEDLGSPRPTAEMSVWEGEGRTAEPESDHDLTPSLHRLSGKISLSLFKIGK